SEEEEYDELIFPENREEGLSQDPTQDGSGGRARGGRSHRLLVAGAARGAPGDAAGPLHRG
uniref:Uncharacterized protein n=1 Tax=Balaenoptera musculus TaxID=9771 RepID=A0A8C0I2D7_BALMU